MIIRPHLLPVLAFSALAVSPLHANTLYKCPGADGRITYTNQKTHNRCEVISQDKPVSTFTPPPAAARNRDNRPAAQPSPADFPRVNGDQQRARDNDRRAILEQELANEQKNLETAKRELAEQETQILPEERIVGGGIQGGKKDARLQTYRDKVQLHERNLDSIRKEIANIR